MTDQHEITRMWSEDELDAALRGLHTDQPDPTTALAIARVKVMAAVSGEPMTGSLAATATPGSDTHGEAATSVAPKRRRWIPIAVGAGIAAVVVAVGLLVPSYVTEHNKPANSAAAISALNQAAVAALGATDEPVAAGQYRYIGTHSWSTVFSGYDTFQDEDLTEVWVPAIPDNPTQDWMLDRRPTGNRVWIQGSEEEARNDGTYMDPVTAGVTLRTTAPCGNFYGPGPCPRAGSWQDPTPSFLAGLPRDPTQLYARLQADAPDNGRGNAELLVYAADALRSGLVPADLRAALYRTLTRLDGVELTDRAANLDGRVGTAIGIDDGQFRQDIIIDPTTGAFIGEREILTGEYEGAPEGTTFSHTAVTTGVVDTIGAIPTK